MCVIYRNRQIFLSTCLYVILAIPQMFTRQIYTAIGQKPEVMEFALTYISYVLPFLYLFVISQTFANFSSSQRQQWMSRNATFGGAVVHIIFVYLFVAVFDMGFHGICAATSIMFFTRFALNVGYVLYYKDLFP